MQTEEFLELDRNEIIDKILEKIPHEELMENMDNCDPDWYTDVVRDAVFQRTVRYNDVQDALAVYHYMSSVEIRVAARNAQGTIND
jgi:hypothetical protein